jgi:hypothetical protein
VGSDFSIVDFEPPKNLTKLRIMVQTSYTNCCCCLIDCEELLKNAYYTQKKIFFRRENSTSCLYFSKRQFFPKWKKFPLKKYQYSSILEKYSSILEFISQNGRISIFQNGKIEI